MANELPLCLFDCSYPEADLKWEFDINVIGDVLIGLQKLWAEHQTKLVFINFVYYFVFKRSTEVKRVEFYIIFIKSFFSKLSLKNFFFGLKV